jgi:RNA polymerase sigma-70 factor (ECF subfamily)
MIDSRLVSGFFDAHAAALVLYARQFLPEKVTAQDVVHDVFVRLIALDRAPDDPAAWLFRAVRNAAISEARSTWRRRRREAHVRDQRAGWFQPQPGDLIDAADAQEALQALDPPLREAVALRLWAQMGFQQIADVTGTSVSTAHDRYRSALSAIRRMLEVKRCRANESNNPMT